MLQPETYDKGLKELIADMERRSGALEKYGHNLELRELNKKADALKGVVDKTQEDVQNMIRKQEREIKMLKDYNAQVEGVGKAVEGVGEAVEQQLMEVMREIKQLKLLSKGNIVKALFDLISWDPPQERVQGQGQGQASGGRRLLASQYTTTAVSQRTRRQAPAAKLGLDAATVLAEAGFNADVAPQDGYDILRAARPSTQDEQLVAEMTTTFTSKPSSRSPPAPSSSSKAGQAATTKRGGPSAWPPRVSLTPSPAPARLTHRSTCWCTSAASI